MFLFCFVFLSVLEVIVRTGLVLSTLGWGKAIHRMEQNTADPLASWQHQKSHQEKGVRSHCVSEGTSEGTQFPHKGPFLKSSCLPAALYTWGSGRYSRWQHRGKHKQQWDIIHHSNEILFSTRKWSFVNGPILKGFSKNSTPQDTFRVICFLSVW